MQSTADPPLFRTVRQALSFAYAIQHYPIISQSVYGSRVFGFTAMSVHDWHAQAALVRRAVEERLSPEDLAFLLAEYSFGATKNAGIKEVAAIIAARNKRPSLTRALVWRHFVYDHTRQSQSQIAAKHGLSQQTVSRADRWVRAEVIRLSAEAEQRLTDLFVRTGLCEQV